MVDTGTEPRTNQGQRDPGRRRVDVSIVRNVETVAELARGGSVVRTPRVHRQPRVGPGGTPGSTPRAARRPTAARPGLTTWRPPSPRRPRCCVVTGKLPPDTGPALASKINSPRNATTNRGPHTCRRSYAVPSRVPSRSVPVLVDRDFGPKTKLLLLDGLIEMTLAALVNENALRSVAVRLYGVWRGDPDKRSQGCVGTLISALIPELTKLGYTDFMQGNQKVMLDELRAAADSATANPDGFLDRLVADRSRRLREWASACNSIDLGQGSLATAAQSPIPISSLALQPTAASADAATVGVG